MDINFDNIFQHIIPMDDFRLKWRFTEEKYDKLPNLDLEQLKPLDDVAAKFLWDYITERELHNDNPFKKDFFKTIKSKRILDDNRTEIKEWLLERGLEFERPVFLTWNQTDAMIVPWKILIKYFDSFYYSASDDLTIIDQSLNWAFLFSHTDEIYFGATKNYKPTEIVADKDFVL